MVHAERQILFHLIPFVLSTNVNNKECDDGRCCLNFYKHQDGSCFECPLGTHGVNCSGTCVRGFYGRFCQSKCECPSDECDNKYGCLKEEDTGNAGPQNTNSQWSNVAYILIGSITTMSVVGLLLYWKAWFSKRSSSNLEIDQLNSRPSANQQENMYDRRRDASASETDGEISMLQVQHNYTSLQGSRIQPEMTRGNDTDTMPSSTDAISPHGTEISCYNVDEVEYEHFDRSTAYHVLSLRRHFHGSLLKSVELSSMRGHRSNNIENQNDCVSVSHDKDVLLEKERPLSEEEIIRQSLIDERINEYIDRSQLMKEMSMKDDADKHQLKTTSSDLNLPVRIGHNTEVLYPRAYSMADGIWSIGDAPEYEDILPNLTKEGVDAVCCSKHGNDKDNKRSNETKNETADDSVNSDASIDGEDDDPVVQNFKTWEAMSPQRVDTGEILPPGQSDEYTQMMRRNTEKKSDTCVESSTLSVEMSITNEESGDVPLTFSIMPLSI
ncbi:uncharacterized protein LOC130046602 isoform X2 [Ostrea edulis]|uniref:uncharacterized protein LOC130046602 isoform X2 n=1 Tax=Ostrea edulis TaxID=37623 RepID=UPI0024AFB312|nr:uncharacterized protein LOC130046602 isoform X2 [Ostrea edulis]